MGSSSANGPLEIAEREPGSREVRMQEERARRAALPRRRMLKALALAPAALAGCAGAGAEQAGRGVAEGRPGGAREEAAPDAALAAIRSFPVPADAEPAFVFRAAVMPVGERR